MGYSNRPFGTAAPTEPGSSGLGCEYVALEKKIVHTLFPLTSLLIVFLVLITIKERFENGWTFSIVAE